jgi:3-oxoacyl-[acyl-carrier-protein] synthase-1
MGDGSAYAYLSMKEAIEELGLTEEISNEKTGIIIGSGGPSIKNVMFAIDSTRSAGPKKWAHLLYQERWQVHVLQL